MKRRARATTGPGMVAENSIVWRSAGDLLEDRLDVGQEAEVEHLVGLVEHERADAGEVEVALASQVEQPAGGADDDLDACLQRLDLRLVGPAAVDGEHPGAEDPSGALEVFGDLDAQLTGGDDDEGQRAAAVGVARRGRRVDALEHRDAEARASCRCRCGLADDVGAVERDRQGQRLDGERGDDAGLGEGRDDRGADPERSEISG